MILDSLGAFLDANTGLLWGLAVGFSLGGMWGFRHSMEANEEHMNTIREFAALLGHFQAAAEVLEEHDLTEEAADRGGDYARANVADLRHKTATEPTPIDRIRNRLPF